jgi:glycosyltransferase involved in cell wall biosynthesis
MRVGQNPAKYVKDVARPARVTAAILNYIPFLSGFYSETLDVLKVCMKSLRENTKVPFDLMVFDNGSCPEVKEFLMNEQAEGNIQYLLLSEKNLGKGGAWNMILSGCPGEIIAYTDSDALFHQGWLEKSLELLETFPNVGMVTARPFRTKEEYITSTLAWGEKAAGARVEKGDFIPFEVFREFDLSLGQTEEEIRQHYETSTDYRLTYKGLSAIAGASHWQFVAKKEVLVKFLPFDMDRPMGQVKQLDQRMNEAGYLRLMPTEPLAMNMSNTLRGVKGEAVREPAITQKSYGLIDFPPIKKILLSLYDAIFRWYYDRRDS